MHPCPGSLFRLFWEVRQPVFRILSPPDRHGRSRRLRASEATLSPSLCCRAPSTSLPKLPFYLCRGIRWLRFRPHTFGKLHINAGNHVHAQAFFRQVRNRCTGLSSRAGLPRQRALSLSSEEPSGVHCPLPQGPGIQGHAVCFYFDAALSLARRAANGRMHTRAHG